MIPGNFSLKIFLQANTYAQAPNMYEDPKTKQEMS
jgi:hypothetical protein